MKTIASEFITWNGGVECDVIRVPLVVSSAARCTSAQPVTFGVPWPKNVLTRAGTITLVASTGQVVTCQSEALAHWSDGSVKWLLVDALLPEGALLPEIEAGKSEFELCIERGKASKPDKTDNGNTLKIDERSDRFVIDTGAARFIVDRRRLGPFARVRADAGELETPETRGLETMQAETTEIEYHDARGERRAGIIERSLVETAGTVRATLLLEGTFRRSRGLRFRCRLSFFAGTGLVRVGFTLHNPNRAWHRGGLWDLGDPGSILFRELSLVWRAGGDDSHRGAYTPRSPGDNCATWIAEPGREPQQSDDGHVSIYQDSSGGENWQSRNHLNREGRVPCRFRGYRVRTSQGEESGLRASPVVAVDQGPMRIVAAVPEFWQQFPKSISAEPGRLRIGLFPNQWDDLFELQGGEQKTHTVWFCFGNAGDTTLESLAWVHAPARAVADSRWTAGTGAVAPFPPAEDDQDDRLRTLLAAALRGPHSLFARRETIDEYGWRNYGEIYADHENAYYKGAKPVISHYNNQYDVVFGALLQWLRCGDAAWFDLADPLARHVIDIDVYHTSRDKAAYSGGLFWHTDHYLDAGRATHRSFSRANCPPGGAYGGGPSCEQNYTTGLLHYYYLTGDGEARNTVLELADWVLRADDGRNNILGLVDDGPTGFASATDRPMYHGPGRGAANSVTALVDAFLASGEHHYLRHTERLIRRVIHPADDLKGRQLLDIERHWSYTMFLAVLARFLDLKAEAGELDETFSYGRASLLAYAQWMLEHERPYFDRREEMEFPTETWAAQELRKANAIRLAAAFAAEGLRQRVLARGKELAERAWSDLLEFESQGSARPLAIMMVEGPRDSSFRREPASEREMGIPVDQFGGAHSKRTDVLDPSGDCDGNDDFGSAVDFVPQRQRVMRRLKHSRGFISLTLRLAQLRKLWGVGVPLLLRRWAKPPIDRRIRRNNGTAE